MTTCDRCKRRHGHGEAFMTVDVTLCGKASTLVLCAPCWRRWTR